MSSLRHPAAPDRLPSGDLENSYFRAWVLRGSEGSSSSGKTGAGCSTPPSPKSLPSTATFPQSRPRRLERSGQQSELTTLHAFNTLSHDGSLVQLEDVVLSKDRALSAVSGISEGQKSVTSQIKSRGHKIFSISQHFGKGDSASPPKKQASIAQVAKQTSYSEKDSHAKSGPHLPKSIQPWPAMETVDPVLASPEGLSSSPTVVSTPKTGLYTRTKKALGLSKSKSEKLEIVLGRTATDDVLDQTSKVLRQMAETRTRIQKRPETSASSTSTTASTVSSIAAQRWKHLRPGMTGSGHSSASSGISSKLSKPPATTPELDFLYTGSDTRQYLSVKMTDPEGPTFLPSEARRVTTPPLSANLERKHKLRGFFFDYRAAHDGETPSSLDPLTFKQRHSSGPERNPPETEWYQAKLDAIDAGEETAREEFALSVPEHLPNSPMCPRHAKHKSGGKGVCVYHGRNDSRSPTVIAISSKPSIMVEL